MMKHTMKTCWAALLLICLLCMLTPAALADGESVPAPAAAMADAVTIAADGTVTLTSSHMAAEKVCSLQLQLEVGQATAGFAFAVDDMTKPSQKDGVLSLYIAGADPLMTEGQTQLVLGKITGVADPTSVTLVPNSLEYVYGTRLVSQAITAPQLENSTGGTIPELNLLIEKANSVGGEGGANHDKYTADSWGNFQLALDNANTVVAKGASATEEELTQAYNALNSAINALVPVGRAALEDAVADAKAMLADGKTYDRAKDLEDAVAAAEAAITANKADTDWDALRSEIESIMEDMTPIVSGEGGGGTQEDPNGGDTDDTEATATPAPTTAATSQAAAPNTGDEQALLPWALVLCLSAALLAVVARRRSER